MNKITPSTFDELSKNLLVYKFFESEPLLDHLVNVLFEKAVEEPRFCQLYAQLCLSHVKQEEFRTGIIKKCQKAFMEKKEEVFKDLTSRLKNAELIEAEKLDLEEQLNAFKSQEKRRISGIVR